MNTDTDTDTDTEPATTPPDGDPVFGPDLRAAVTGVQSHAQYPSLVNQTRAVRDTSAAIAADVDQLGGWDPTVAAALVARIANRDASNPTSAPAEDQP